MKNLKLYIATLLFLPFMFVSCSSDQWSEADAPKPAQEGVNTQIEQWTLLLNIEGETFEFENPEVSNWYKNGELYHKVWTFSSGDVKVNLSYKTETVKGGSLSYVAGGIGSYNGDSFILNNLSYDSANLFTGDITMNLCTRQNEIPTSLQLVKQ